MSSTVSRTVERPIGLIMIMKSSKNCDNHFFLYLDRLDLIKRPLLLSHCKIKTSSSKTHLIFDCLLFGHPIRDQFKQRWWNSTFIVYGEEDRGPFISFCHVDGYYLKLVGTLFYFANNEIKGSLDCRIWPYPEGKEIFTKSNFCRSRKKVGTAATEILLAN